MRIPGLLLEICAVANADVILQSAIANHYVLAHPLLVGELGIVAVDGVGEQPVTAVAQERDDRTTFLAVQEDLGPTIAHSMFTEQDCFLALPEWQKALLSQPDQVHNKGNETHHEVFALLAFLSNLTKAARCCRKGEKHALESAVELALAIHDKLHEVGQGLEIDIISCIDVGSPSWIDVNAAVQQVYLQPGHDKSRFISGHAVLTLIVNKVLPPLLARELIQES